ncbi:PLP-dependent aminotransferase family protein [Rugamonas sp.]|uniref:MocR-like pyridoxine biosynthesis transcription factor PdxR n=1 Tax=Rugamonas sp. TaxID=1926287 RepID=UPI0025EEEB84|nr:PLP-dependent aminotransferase family protein [Rugamonas sp.]
MELHLIIEGGRDLSEQLYSQISQAVRAGRLAEGQQLPPTRLLALQLGISRKPVAEAYSRLTYDRILVAHTGRGTFVGVQGGSGGRAAQGVELAARPTLDKWLKFDTPFRAPTPEGRSQYEFIGGTPAPAHFPQDEWRRCILHGLRQDADGRGRYASTEGVAALREAIVRHAGYARGVRCGARQIVITNGAQQSLDLLGRILLEPGSVVAVEDPGYPIARALFKSQGATVVSVPVDREGIVAALIPSDTRLIYVTPAHQFPLGMAMSTARKEALLARALEIGAIIIEDDYDSEFRYEGRPTDSLQSMDTHGLVVFLSSLSKVMLPELRIGYVAVPEALLPALSIAKHLTDWHSASMTQHALAKFIDDGHLARHIRRGHSIYASRRDALLRGLAQLLAPWFTAVPATAGFHMAAMARKDVDINLLIRLARRAGVGLYSLAGFYAEQEPRQGLFFGFGSIDTLDIETALLRVRDILIQMDGVPD